MAVPISRCRGFTNPVIFLIRNSLEIQIQQPGRTITTTTRATPFRWPGNTRSFTTGRPLGAKPGPKPGPKSGSNRSIPGAARPSAPAPAPAPTLASRVPPSRGATAVSLAARNLESSPSPSPSLSSSLSQVGYAQSLAQKSTPTTLYEAPAQGLFLASSYAAGLFSMLAAGVNVWFNVYNAPAGAPAWTPYVFGAVGAMMAALGTRFAMMPASVVRSIAVLPASSSTTTATTTTTTTKPAKATNATATSASASAPAAVPVMLEIRARRLSPFPFLPLRRMRVEPGRVVLGARLFRPRAAEPTAAERLAARRAEERRLADARRYEREHLMTAPFRDGRRAAAAALAAVRRGLTGEGFVAVEVDGARYKLDVACGGYALEDGRALDRIVRVEEAPAPAPAAGASSRRR